MYSASAMARGAVLSGAPQLVTINVTLANGTSKTIKESDIIENSFYIDRVSSQYGSIPLGAAASNEIHFQLNNVSGTYNNVDFNGAEMSVLFYYSSDNYGTRSPLCDGGKFYIIESPLSRKIIDVVGYGSLVKYDVIDNNAGGTASNIHIDNLFRSAAIQCMGDNAKIDRSFVSTIAQKYLYNFRYPSGKDVTCRNVIGWGAALCGGMAREHGNDGTVQILRYETTGLTIDGSNSFEGARWGKTIAPTGLVGYDANGVEYSAGSAGYEIELRSNGAFENCFRQDGTSDYHQRVIDDTWAVINSITYTPISVRCLPMPWLECGDLVTYTDENGTDHDVILTHVRYYLNGQTLVESNVWSQEEHKLNSALPSDIKRSSICTEMLRLNALKSINFVDALGDFSTAGTFFDLAQGVIKSVNFAIDALGNAKFKGMIEAQSGGKIGDLNIVIDPESGQTGLRCPSATQYDTDLEIYPQMIRMRRQRSIFEITSYDGSISMNVKALDTETDETTELTLNKEGFEVKIYDSDLQIFCSLDMSRSGGNLTGTWEHNGSPI